jgi:hypothetical protein
MYRYAPSLFYKLGDFLKLMVRGVLLVLPSSVVVAGERVVSWFDKMVGGIPPPGKTGMDSFMWALNQIHMHKAAYANTWNLLTEVYAWFTDLFACTVGRLLPGGQNGIKCCATGMWQSWTGTENVVKSDRNESSISINEVNKFLDESKIKFSDEVQERFNRERDEALVNGHTQISTELEVLIAQNLTREQIATFNQINGKPSRSQKPPQSQTGSTGTNEQDLSSKDIASSSFSDIRLFDLKKLIQSGKVVLSPEHQAIYDKSMRETYLNDAAPKRDGFQLAPRALLEQVAPQLLDNEAAADLLETIRPHFDGFLYFSSDQAVKFADFDGLIQNQQVDLSEGEKRQFYDEWNKQMDAQSWFNRQPTLPSKLLSRLTRGRMIKALPTQKTTISDARLKMIIKRNVSTVSDITLNLYRWKTTPRALQLIQSVPHKPYWNPDHQFVSFSAKLVARKYPAAVRGVGPFKVLHVDVSKLPEPLRDELARQNLALCGKRSPCYGT